MFYVGSLESDFKSPTATGRILNTALVLFRRQQSILMLTDDAEFLHLTQHRITGVTAVKAACEAEFIALASQSENEEHGDR